MSSLGKEYKIYDDSKSTAWHGTFWAYDRWMIVIAFLCRKIYKCCTFGYKNICRIMWTTGTKDVVNLKKNNQRNSGKRETRVNIFAFLIGP